MRVGMLVFMTVGAVVLLAGCASSPGPKQHSGVRWIAQPAAGADHPPMIDMTYKNQHPPRYPMPAVAAHHQGVVVLNVYVDAQNRVSKVEVRKSSGYPELDAAAAAAAQNWRFTAGVKNGKPYASVVRVPVTFSM
jgi:protein TonB